jgi:hypothetical protein
VFPVRDAVLMLSENPTPSARMCCNFQGWLVPNISTAVVCAITGTMRFTANEFFSYYIDMTARIEGTDIQTSNRIHLKDQVQYRLMLSTALRTR